jgi:hypothetical protein
MTIPYPVPLNKPWMVRKQQLTFKHIFSMQYLYQRIRDWLNEEGYSSDSYGGDADKWMEKLYLERVDGKGAKQVWIWWRVKKHYANSFFTFYLDMEYHLLNLQTHEIVVEGQKVKTNKGECEFTVTSKMALDEEGGWDKNFILRNDLLRRFFLGRVYKKRIEMVEDELVKDVSRLIGAVKQYYQLESWIPEYKGPGFQPAKGQ